VGSDGSIHTKHWDGKLNEWVNLGGTFKSTPAVASWDIGRIDVFGVGSDGAVYHKGFSGKWDADWENLDGDITSAPTVVSWGLEKLDVFVVGKYNNVYQKSYEGSKLPKWSTAWKKVGSSLLDYLDM
jgi:hypothetical protein